MNKDFIHIYEPYIVKNQKNYVLDCIDSNMYTQWSPYISKFEEYIANYIGTKYCVAVCNGSVSLMVILKALGIGFGDEVITQNFTYAATVSSIINVGALPVVVDTDFNYQMNIEQIEQNITSKTRAVMVAGLYGYCANMNNLKQICEKHNIILIEDAAEVFGCSQYNKNIGTFGIASSFSFYGGKIIHSGGEGGCVCTDDGTLAEELILLRGQGHVADFYHKKEGYNFRMAALNAAIGCAQFESLEPILSLKKKIADLYRKYLHPSIGRVTDPITQSSEWLPLFILPPSTSYMEFKKKMLDFNIETRPTFTPVSLMPGFKVKRNIDLSMSESRYKLGFSLPAHPALSEKELEYIISSVNNIVENK